MYCTLKQAISQACRAGEGDQSSWYGGGCKLQPLQPAAELACTWKSPQRNAEVVHPRVHHCQVVAKSDRYFAWSTDIRRASLQEVKCLSKK
jgi:coproporphyrinogen III oxidase